MSARSPPRSTSCSIVRTAAPSWDARDAWSPSRDSHPSRQPGATPGSLAPSWAARRSRVTLVAQWLIAAVVIGFASRELARQWRDVAPALQGLRLDWTRVSPPAILPLAAYPFS